MAEQTTPWMRTAFQEPKLSREAERDLLTKIRAGDRTALTALMVSQFKTVFFIAKRYQGMGLDLEDLVQEGFGGLFRAIKKFNPDKGCCLATYASNWIMISITRALTTKGHLVRLPVYAQALLYRITKTSNLLSEQLHRAPTDEELAEHTGLDIKKMRSFQHCWQPTVNLDERFTDEDSGSEAEEDRYAIFADPATVYDRSKEETLHKIDLLMKILEDNHVLTPKERAILSSRFGLGTEQSQTLTAIGKRFRVTRERIRQIQNQLLRKLRKHMQEAEARSFMTAEDRDLREKIEKCRRITPYASRALAETPNT
jgi:RNA polymerase primary sigma factor